MISLKRISSIVISASLALLTSLTSGCMQLFYYPTHDQYVDLKKHNVPHQDLFLKTEDNRRLHAWFISLRSDNQPRQGIIVQFHGNGENMTSHFLSLMWLVERGYDLLTFDYRGYGSSDGEPSPAGLRIDGRTAIEYASSQLRDGEQFILYGQSLGGAVLLDTLTSDAKFVIPKVNHIVLEATFLSYQSVARAVLNKSWLTWSFQPLAYALVTDRFSARERLKILDQTPKFVLHGDRDRVVPFSEGEKLFEALSGSKRFLKAQDADHLQAATVGEGRYQQEIFDTISQESP